MSQISFKTQGYISLAVAVVGFLFAHFFRMGIFYNIAWIIIGVLFVINPVWPKFWDWANHNDLRKSVRIAAALVIIIFGFWMRFGV